MEEKFITTDLNNVGINQIIDLRHHRKSPSPGADATKPKYQLITPSGLIYFKFGLTENEICAEIISHYVATLLEIPVAKVALAKYKNSLGIASWDVGSYHEPEDHQSYSIKDFIHIKGFVEMCLFDYLVMNEDRHAGNWGYKEGSMRPLFDHNICFGGSQNPRDFDYFMEHVTSSLTAGGEYDNKHDSILKTLVQCEPKKVRVFLDKVKLLPQIDIQSLEGLRDYEKVKKLLSARIVYMLQKGEEYGL